MGLSIVILNYRTPALTIDCLRSIDAVRDEIAGTRVVVVDNGSGDESASCLETTIAQSGWAGWCELLPLKKNLGFAGGNNRGIEHVLRCHHDSPWILLLNSDTIVRPGALRQSERVLRQHAAAGMMSCRLIGPDGSTQTAARPLPSPFLQMICAVGLPWIAPRLFGWANVYDPPAAKLQQPHDCGWIIGAYMFIRRSALEQAGAFDESFFFYGEDVELCHRFHRHGWRIRYDPAAEIVHLGGGSSDPTRVSQKWRDSQMWKARYLVQRKCYGALWAQAVRAVDVMALVLRSAKLLIAGQCRSQRCRDALDAMRLLGGLHV